MVNFQRAVRKQVKLKVALAGISGSGKTMSALLMARGMGKKIAVIDTENGSASLYSDKFDFDVVVLEPPFTTEKYVSAIEAAERANYDVIIVDSFSHAWGGEGGVTEKKAAIDARGGNQFANWKEPKRDYGRLKNAILHSPSHIICTLRCATAYEVSDDEGKKKRPQKIGLKPIAEPNIEYEFTVVFDLASDNTANASKDRTSLFKGEYFVITEKTGEKLLNWINSASTQESAEQSSEIPPEAHAPVNPTSDLGMPARSGFHCELEGCPGELVLFEKDGKKIGYRCEKSTRPDDGHTRMRMPAYFEKVKEARLVTS
jgi:hypothetical protein